MDYQCNPQNSSHLTISISVADMPLVQQFIADTTAQVEQLRVEHEALVTRVARVRARLEYLAGHEWEEGIQECCAILDGRL